PSFASCSITTNPQNCSTTLSGGADPMPPTLGTFSPAAGAVGTAVNTTRTNFRATPGPGSSVVFNGTVATPTSWSDGSIVVPVPSGALSGSIVVTTANGQATSTTSFTVTVSGPPHIDGVSPASGPFGKQVTITGTNFGAIQGS